MRETEIQHDPTTREELDVDEVLARATDPDRLSLGLDHDQNARLLGDAKLAALRRIEMLREAVMSLDMTDRPASEMWSIIIIIEQGIRAARPDGQVPPF